MCNVHICVYKCEVIILLCVVIYETTEPIELIFFFISLNFPKKELDMVTFHNFLKYFEKLKKKSLTWFEKKEERQID